MPGLDVINVFKSFGPKKVLNGITFQVMPGQIAALLGPSGCGKSTLLNLISGLDTPDSGQMIWDELDLGKIPAHRRGFGLMFQDFALFPHMNVFENVSFGLRMSKLDPNQIKQRTQEVLELVGLSEIGKRDVNSLSGGEQQRVALARSLAPQPCFLMLDEPLGALDRVLRDRLILELRSILGSIGQTTLYVTHDQEEAFSLADLIIVINNGRVEQIGSPMEIYNNPANAFVAGFLGMTNIVTGQALNGKIAETAIGPIALSSQAHGSITILLRPEKFTPGAAGPYSLEGEVIETIYRGSTCRIMIQVNNQRLTFDLPVLDHPPDKNKRLQLSYDPNSAVQFWNTD